MHTYCGTDDGKIQLDLIRDRDLQASYTEDDFMNLDDNIFELDAESRELFFGRSDMDDHNNRSHNPQYDPMQTDPDFNTILARMPTPVSNDIRATTEQHAFMSPLQVDQQGYDHLDSVSFGQQNEEMYFTPLISPAVTPMDMMRLHDNDGMVPGVEPVYFSPLSSPALERGYLHNQNDARRSQSMVGLSTAPATRRSENNIADVQRSVRRAPYSPLARASVNRKRNSISHLNLNGSQSEQSSDSVSPEPLPSGSMPPPPPRNTSSTKLSDKSNGRTKPRPKRAATGEMAPATPASFLNMQLQHSEQRPNAHVESTVTFDHGSADTSPATAKSASSTPTFGPTSVGPSMESPSFISIPSSFDPNSTTATTPTLTSNPAYPRRMRRPSRGQSRSSSSSPAFKPMISPSLQPLLPGGSFTLNILLTSGTNTDAINMLASKSNYQNILEGTHSQLGLSYPKELSSGIESRRTSHKVAEQARRSRINNAIDHLGTMLPGETDGISKAITVEKAIDYIKNLEEQLAKVKAELAAKE